MTPGPKTLTEVRYALRLKAGEDIVERAKEIAAEMDRLQAQVTELTATAANRLQELDRVRAERDLAGNCRRFNPTALPCGKCVICMAKQAAGLSQQGDLLREQLFDAVDSAENWKKVANVRSAEIVRLMGELDKARARADELQKVLLDRMAADAQESGIFSPPETKP